MLKNGNYYKKYLKMRLDSAENEVDSVEIMVDSAKKRSRFYEIINAISAENKQ